MLTRNELVRYKATLSEWHPPDEFIRPVGELEEKVGSKGKRPGVVI